MSARIAKGIWPAAGCHSLAAGNRLPVATSGRQLRLAVGLAVCNPAQRMRAPVACGNKFSPKEDNLREEPPTAL